MKTIRIIFLAVITASIVFLTTCQKEKVSGISLNKTELYLSPGDMEKLAVTIYPEDADNKKVVWDSDNPTVAIVNDEGLVTAIKDGTAIITVTTTDGNHTASCTVSVDYREKWIGDWDFTTVDSSSWGVMPPFEITIDTTNFVGKIEKNGSNRLKIEFKPDAKEPDYGDPPHIYGLMYPIVDESGTLTYPNLNLEHGGFTGFLSNDSINIHYIQTIGHAAEEQTKIKGKRINKK